MKAVKKRKVEVTHQLLVGHDQAERTVVLPVAAIFANVAKILRAVMIPVAHLLADRTLLLQRSLQVRIDRCRRPSGISVHDYRLLRW